MYISVNIFYCLFIFRKYKENTKKTTKFISRKIRFTNFMNFNSGYACHVKSNRFLKFNMLFRFLVFKVFKFYDIDLSDPCLVMPFQCSVCDLIRYLKHLFLFVFTNTIRDCNFEYSLYQMNANYAPMLFTIFLVTYYILVVWTSIEGMLFQCTECDLRQRWCKV